MASMETTLKIDVQGIQPITDCIRLLAGATGEASLFIERERQMLFDSVSLSDGTVPDATDRLLLAEYDAVLARLKAGVEAAIAVSRDRRGGRRRVRKARA